MRRQFFILVAGMGLVIGGSSVLAHHAFSAEFEATTPVSFRGTVTRVEWINPHAWVHVATKKADGTTVEWMVEGGTPNTLMRRGITKESLPIGTEILVTGYQAKDGSNRANGRDITYPDGRKLFLGSTGTGAPYDKDAKAKN